MSESEARPKKRWRPPFGLLMLAAVLFGFGLSVFLRSFVGPKVSPLEAMIVANEPAENVSSLAFDTEGKFLVGTSLGLIQGSGKEWSRSPLPGPVAAILPIQGGGLYAAGPAIGLNRVSDGRTEPLLKGDVTALAADPANPSRLLAAARDGLMETKDGGRTWSRLPGPGQDVLALAIAPGSGRILAGTVQGTLWYRETSSDQWTPLAAPGGSVTAVLFDPWRSGRLWMAAGGKVYASDDGGNAWRAAKLTGEARPVVSIAVSPTGSHDPWGITAGGLLRSVAP